MSLDVILCVVDQTYRVPYLMLPFHHQNLSKCDGNIHFSWYIHPQASHVHIRQTTSACVHVTTIKYQAHVTCNVIIYHIVPSPNVSITALTTQIVGYWLIIKCSGTTVRGITSDVVLEWRCDDSTINSTSVNCYNGQFTSVQSFLHYPTSDDNWWMAKHKQCDSCS